MSRGKKSQAAFLPFAAIPCADADGTFEARGLIVHLSPVGLCLVILFCLITLVFAQKAYAAPSQHDVWLSRVAVGHPLQVPIVLEHSLSLGSQDGDGHIMPVGARVVALHQRIMNAGFVASVFRSVIDACRDENQEGTFVLSMFGNGLVDLRSIFISAVYPIARKFLIGENSLASNIESFYRHCFGLARFASDTRDLIIKARRIFLIDENVHLEGRINIQCDGFPDILGAKIERSLCPTGIENEIVCGRYCRNFYPRPLLGLPSLVSFFQGLPLEGQDYYRTRGGEAKAPCKPYDRIASGAFLFLFGFGLGMFGISRAYYLCNESPNEKTYKTSNERRRAIVAGAAIIFGWLITVYGGFLTMSEISNQCYRRPSNVL